jgi:hypothetical protein
MHFVDKLIYRNQLRNKTQAVVTLLHNFRVSNLRRNLVNKLFCLLSLLLGVHLYADDFSEETTFLKEFHSNPKQAMERLPQVIIEGKAVERGFIDYHHLRRIPDAFNIFAAPKEEDLAASIVEEGKVVANIKELDSLKATSAQLKKGPWADSYWPLYKGQIGIRYGDPGFPDSKDWSVNRAYVQSHSAMGLAASGHVDLLSPAEKYDFLVGDSGWTLTEFAWHEGQQYFQQYGRVPTWMGICHGWSGASHMMAKVFTKPVTVRSTNGIPITFYPSDIKALQSILWANASPATRYIGSRCKIGMPQKDANGRVIEPACFDNNPASFHLVMTNQLGINKRSFIFDSDFDFEVWNFPLLSYRYKYFNPQTLQPTTDYNRAIIPVKNYTLDKFKAYRTPGTEYVIGIIMDDTFVIEVTPSRGPGTHTPTKTLRHYYDLELDAGFNIIGGEWYTNAHPDFIWTFAADAQASTREDSSIQLSEWQRGSSLPNSWAALAQRASGRGTPLFNIVQGILNHSNEISSGDEEEP